MTRRQAGRLHTVVGRRRLRGRIRQLLLGAIVTLICSCAFIPMLARGTAVGGWHTVEMVRFAWRKHQPAYTLTVEANSTTHDSPRLRIQKPNGGGLTISLDGGVVPVADALLGEHALIAGNLVRAKYVYFSSNLRDRRNEPMLVVFGWAYGSAPGSIRIVSLDSQGKPRTLFSSDQFQLTGVVTRDQHRVLEIIGRPAMSEESGCLETYDPYIVYRHSKTRGDRFIYSEVASRNYNDRYYFGWAGPKATDKLAVVLCKRGHGRILLWNKAEKLYGR